MTMQLTLSSSAESYLSGVDPRLVFLERAAARLILVDACLMSLDEAYGGLVASLMRSS